MLSAAVLIGTLRVKLCLLHAYKLESIIVHSVQISGLVTISQPTTVLVNVLDRPWDIIHFLIWRRTGKE